jgi:hypothetical protein
MRGPAGVLTTSISRTYGVEMVVATPVSVSILDTEP